MLKKERKNKIDPKSIRMRFNFLTLLKCSGTSQVVLYLNGEVLLVYRLFALLLTRLGVCALIPYVQDAILNLRHPT